MNKESINNIYGRIYVITNLLNQKKYVGLTTKSLKERFQAHLNKAIIERSAVQRAIKKYGKENFIIEELDIAHSKEELYKKEEFWISKLNTFLGYGYNLTNGGGGITEMSQEIKDKISKSKTGKSVPKLKGLKRSKDQKLYISRQMGSRPVKGTHKETGKVIYLDYVTQGREYNFNPSLISAVIYGKRSHHKGYIFEYVNNANPDLIIESKKSMAVQRIETETVNQNIMSPRDRNSLNKG
jgi:group I intron endonuclease